MVSNRSRDFEINIGLKQGSNGYPVSASSQLAGETAAGEFLVLPWREEDLRQLLYKLRQFSTSAIFLEKLGDHLFIALFQRRIKTLYDESLGLLGEKGDLRLRLRFEDPRIASLPWELLYDKDRAEFLALSKRVQIIRHLPVSRPIRKIAVKPPLRVLVAIASPKDTISSSPMDVEREKSSILRAFNELQDINATQIDFLVPTRRDSLRERVKDNFHILHFIGHGKFENGVGSLRLEDDDGWSDDIDGRTLAVFLKRTSIRLVMLNACEGARGLVENVEESTHAGFTGVAQSLVEAGLPAVIAMQFKITEDSAQRFTSEFYKSLTQFQDVDQCVTSAREALLSACGWDYPDWATPILFLRGSSGTLFEKQPNTKTKESSKTVKVGSALVISHPVCGTLTIPWSPSTPSPLTIVITRATMLIRRFEPQDEEGTNDV